MDLRADVSGSTESAGTREQPWLLKTPGGRSEFTAFRDDALDPPALVVRVGKTELRYRLRCLGDLHAMLKAQGDWMLLGGADEQKPAAEGTVEAWPELQEASCTRVAPGASVAPRPALAK